MTSGLGDHANSDEFRPAVEDAGYGVSGFGVEWRESRHSGHARAPLVAMASKDVDMGDDV